MDPATLSIVTLLGLTVTYLQEKRNREESVGSANIDDYKEWLRRKEHQHVLSELQDNSSLLSSIEELFQSNQDNFGAKPDELNTAVSSIASKLEGWSAITDAFPHSPSLSEQAVQILQWLNARESSGFILSAIRAGHELVPIDGKGDRIEIDDQRFLHDDLNQLCLFGLLMHDLTPTRGDDRYRITRLGASVGNQ